MIQSIGVCVDIYFTSLMPGADKGIKWGGCKIILFTKKLEIGTKTAAVGEIFFRLKRLKKGQN